MQPLNLSERQEAIHLISSQYFDADVIAAVRSLLRKKHEEQRLWKAHLEQHYSLSELSNDLPDPALDDTKPFSPVFDGD